MLTERRQEEIVKIVAERQSITVQELKELFQTSESTIRRDITALAHAGRLVKVFGGAIAQEAPISHQELRVSQKEEVNREEKLRIARYAASLVEEEDYVYIDAGTTTGYMIDELQEYRATYITNAVSHAKRLAEKGFRVFLIGGELKGITEAVIGAEAVQNLQKYHFSKGFFGTNGIAAKYGYTTPDISEALVKQTAMQNTRVHKRYILADYEKFGVASSVTFSGFDGTVILTDRPQEKSKWNGAELIVVEKGKR